MDQDALHKRGHALENLFFDNIDHQLIEKLRQNVEREKAQTSLMSATGINDKDLANELLDLGIGNSTMSAFSLFPLVWVAWADRTMVESEKQAIAKAASESNIDADSPAMGLLQSWLSSRPGDDLKQAWLEYAGGLKNIASPETVKRVQNTVISRANEVASAAGGFLGLTSKVSAAEQSVLAQIEKAFH